MEFMKLLEQHIQESAIVLKRRANMLGQHLSNVGFEDVEVTMHLEVKARDPHGSGVTTQKLEGSYKKYAQGFGPANIQGSGSLEDVDGMIPAPHQPPPSQTPPAQFSPGAAIPPLSVIQRAGGSRRPSAFGGNGSD